MVAKKRASKRQTLQQKYKIQKRVKEHHKRLKKGVLVRSGKKRTVDHIPNDWPYKADLLQEIAAAKIKMELVKQKQKEKRSETMMKKRMGIVDDVPQKNELLPAVEHFEEKVEEDDQYEIKTQALGQNSRRAFLRELRKIVDNAEVILHVLDARDPIGTKSTAIEEMVLSAPNKKLVYILNKADLVPRNVLIGWLTYLRQFHPAVPFKCNTQNQKGNLGRTSGKLSSLDTSALISNQTIGAEELLSLLKNYCRMDGTQTKSSIAVGIVGFPNVGKSSLINSLTRTRSVNVSSTPGHTKMMQEVILDKNIRLLDSPGVVFADGDTSSTILRNCVNVDEMSDLISPIEAILERCPAPYLMQLYSIPRFQQNDCMSFLALVARSTGKLKRGGIPNIDAAAKGILHDWNDGKIKYYCKPPVIQKASHEAIQQEQESGDTRILSAYSSQLNFDQLDESDIRVLDALNRVDDTAFVPVDLEYVGGDGERVEEGMELADNNEEKGDEDDEIEEERGSRSRTTSSASASTISRPKKVKKSPAQHDEEGENTMPLRLKQKKAAKKAAKDSRRSLRVEDPSTLQDYNFETDFQY